MPRQKLKLYDLFPPCFEGVDVMRKHFDEEIVKMGFNACWLNPFLECGKTPVIRKLAENSPEYKVDSSIYAATWRRDHNGNFFFNEDLLAYEPGVDENERNASAVTKMQEFTQAMRDRGITPVFDLVLNHVASDSPCLCDQNFRGIFQSKPHPLYNDAIGFQYESEEKAQIAFDRFWKDKIDWFIDVLGFRGVRVDCVTYTSPYILKIATKYISEKLEKKYGIGWDQQTIFGELIEGIDGGDANRLRRCWTSEKLIDKDGKPIKSHGHEQWREKSDCILNMMLEIDPAPFTHFMNTKHVDIPYSLCDRVNGDADGTVHNGVRQSEITLKTALLPKSASGTIGGTGSHDGLTLKQTTDEKHPFHRNKEPTHEEEIYEMRQSILWNALSNGGYFLLSGDEYGDKPIKTPFTHYWTPKTTDPREETIGPMRRPLYPHSKDCVEEKENGEKVYGPKISFRRNPNPKVNLTTFITNVNSKLVDQIEYQEGKPPLCFLLKLDNPKYANFFIAFGNFTFKTTGKNYVIFDFTNDDLEPKTFFAEDRSAIENKIAKKLEEQNPIYQGQATELQKDMEKRTREAIEKRRQQCRSLPIELSDQQSDANGRRSEQLRAPKPMTVVTDMSLLGRPGSPAQFAPRAEAPTHLPSPKPITPRGSGAASVPALRNEGQASEARPPDCSTPCLLDTSEYVVL